MVKASPLIGTEDYAHQVYYCKSKKRFKGTRCGDRHTDKKRQTCNVYDRDTELKYLVLKTPGKTGSNIFSVQRESINYHLNK